MCSVEVIMCSVEVITCSVEANNVIVEGQLKVLNSKSTNNEQSDPLKTKEKEINKNKHIETDNCIENMKKRFSNL